MSITLAQLAPKLSPEDLNKLQARVPADLPSFLRLLHDLDPQVGAPIKAGISLEDIAIEVALNRFLADEKRPEDIDLRAAIYNRVKTGRFWDKP